ncbi:hypothetical protein ABFS83_05G079300 [Erythranthe nasuta]
MVYIALSEDLQLLRPPPPRWRRSISTTALRETLQTKLSYNPIGRFLYYHLVNIYVEPLFFPIWSYESFTYSTRVVLNVFMALRRLFVEISSIPISSASSSSPFALCVYMVWTVSSITAYRGGRWFCPEFLAQLQQDRSWMEGAPQNPPQLARAWMHTA